MWKELIYISDKIINEKSEIKCTWTLQFNPKSVFIEFLFILKPYGHSINNSLKGMPLLTSHKNPNELCSLQD